jgi:hypothetical protein
MVATAFPFFSRGLSPNSNPSAAAGQSPPTPARPSSPATPPHLCAPLPDASQPPATDSLSLPLNLLRHAASPASRYAGGSPPPSSTGPTPIRWPLLSSASPSLPPPAHASYPPCIGDPSQYDHYSVLPRHHHLQVSVHPGMLAAAVRLARAMILVLILIVQSSVVSCWFASCVGNLV